jgi:hypothetical protein
MQQVTNSAESYHSGIASSPVMRQAAGYTEGPQSGDRCADLYLLHGCSFNIWLPDFWPPACMHSSSLY